jgi:hypothetical protein
MEIEVHRFFDWLMLALYVAIIFLLVRPKSQGPVLVGKFGDLITGVMRAATGGGTWSG